MRKSTGLFATLGIAVGVLLVGCQAAPAAAPAPAPAGGAPAQSQAAPAPAAKAAGTRYISIGTGGTGGSNYVVGAAIAKILNQYLPGVNATSEATAGTVENIRRVQAGDMTLGFATTDSSYYALRGEREFEGQKYPDIQALFRGQEAPYLFLARSETGVKTMADLKGKKIGLGPKGGGLSAGAILVFEAHGLKISDYTPLYYSYDETAQGMQNKTLDAGYFAIGSGTTQEVTNSVPSVAVPFDENVLKGITKQYPYMATAIVPGKMYKGFEKDIPTWTTPLMVLARKDLDPQLAYDITKTVYEHTNMIVEINDYYGKQYTLERAVTAVSIPMHPGAEKYFKEKGATK